MSGPDRLLECSFHLNRLQAGSIPPPAKGFDQRDRGDQALAQDLGGKTLAVKQGLLCVDDVEVGDQASAVAIIRDLQSTLRRVNGKMLRFSGPRQHAEAGK